MTNRINQNTSVPETHSVDSTPKEESNETFHPQTATHRESLQLWEDLPPEIKGEVLEFLPAADLARFRRVSRGSRALIDGRRKFRLMIQAAQMRAYARTYKPIIPQQPYSPFFFQMSWGNHGIILRAKEFFKMRTLVKVVEVEAQYDIDQARKTAATISDFYFRKEAFEVITKQEAKNKPMPLPMPTHPPKKHRIVRTRLRFKKRRRV